MYNINIKKDSNTFIRKQLLVSLFRIFYIFFILGNTIIIFQSTKSMDFDENTIFCLMAIYTVVFCYLAFFVLEKKKL